MTGAGRARKAHSSRAGASNQLCDADRLFASGRPQLGTRRRHAETPRARLRVNSRDARFAAGVKERDRGRQQRTKGKAAEKGSRERTGTPHDEGRTGTRRARAAGGDQTKDETARNARRPGREKHAHEQSDARQPGPAERTPRRGAQYARPGENQGDATRWRRSSTAEAWTQRERCLRTWSRKRSGGGGEDTWRQRQNGATPKSSEKNKGEDRHKAQRSGRPFPRREVKDSHAWSARRGSVE
ncbi:hypothetical protein ERJ75_000791400 [Trypanosoma vivax]|nr:hypothetical protein ERJ75_000791400 [Trypanosoma vivax]